MSSPPVSLVSHSSPDDDDDDDDDDLDPCLSFVSSQREGGCVAGALCHIFIHYYSHFANV